MGTLSIAERRTHPRMRSTRSLAMLLLCTLAELLMLPLPLLLLVLLLLPLRLPPPFRAGRLPDEEW